MVPSTRSAFSFSLVAVLVVVSSAFAPTTSTQCPRNSVVRYASNNEENNSKEKGRRQFIQQFTTATSLVFAGLAGPSAPANAGLLDDFGTDPQKIATPQKVVEKPAGAPKRESEIEPTLKGSYYYPTAKKRYLPRITKVTQNIGEVPQQIANGQWEEVEAFAKIADNAVLPLQLYVSSLDGQGLSMSNSYAKVMKKDALEFEKQFKIFEKAIKKKDKDGALTAIQEMGVAVVDFRQAGRLTDEDGNIPSVDEIKRSTMRRVTQSGFILSS